MHSKRIQKKVKDDYNTIAEGFSETRNLPWKDFQLFCPYYRKDFRVLDLGCGNGRLLQFLKVQGYCSYLGVDQSEELLKHARKNWPNEAFLEADMTELPLNRMDFNGTAKFDAIFAIASFHHLPPLAQLSALKHWKTRLKPGGFLFMTNWNLHQPRFFLPLLKSLLLPSYGFRGVLIPWRRSIQRRRSVRRYYFAFTKTRLQKLLKQAGYRVLWNDYTRDGRSARLFSGKNILSIAHYEADGRSH